MAFQVRTTHGRPFRRAGLMFGPEPAIVSDEQLAEVIVPGDARRKIEPRTVKDVLLAEPILICQEARSEPAEKPEGTRRK